jgi:predicted lipoprotein with Yx(FWY)xxD motif
MKHRYFTFLGAVGAAGLLLMMLVAACGSNTGSGGGAYGGGNIGASQTATAAAVANANATATAAATSSSGCGRYCTQPTPTPTTSGGGSITIQTTPITVAGKTVTVLTNAQGQTLYYRTSDTPTSVCSGGCASAWPPIISASIPSAPASLPGKLALLSDANGSQVTYNGHPLYTYSGDTGPGQSNGQGFGGVWFVVTTTLGA